MRKNFVITAFSAGLLFLAGPAQAQYNGGIPYSAGTFYPLGGMLGSPFTSYARYGMPGMGAASTGLWYGSYLGSGLIRSALFFGTTKLNGNHTSIHAEDYEKPAKNSASGNGSYQEVHADWLPAPGSPTAASAPGAFTYYPNPAAAPLPAPSPVPAGLNEQVSQSSRAVHRMGQRAPIAEGFIDLVNNKFNGNISQAMSDPEAHSWCQALGLKSNVHLSDAREKTIEGLFKDSALDPVTKVEAIKALMHS